MRTCSVRASEPYSQGHDDEYYFGPDLLVAPVLTSGTQRGVHLPEGEWLDYWSGARYPGPTDLVSRSVTVAFTAAAPRP